MVKDGKRQLMLNLTMKQKFWNWKTILLCCLFVINIHQSTNKSISRQGRQGRIAGGDEVKPNTLPWQVTLIIDPKDLPKGAGAAQGIKANDSLCGGVILCAKFVMTGGGCVQEGGAPFYTVLVGMHNMNLDEETNRTSSRHKIKGEPKRPPNLKDFNGVYTANDLSIVELEPPIEMRPEAQALYLPNPSDTAFTPGKTPFVISGWGRLSMVNPKAAKLRSVTLPYISDDKCQNSYSVPRTVVDADNVTKKDFQFKFTPNNMLCAGDALNGKIDACEGDSGGALAWLDRKTNEVKLIGLISWGHGCAGSEKDAPGVYTKITSALDWVKQTIGTCNTDACSKGMCMTKQKLDREAIHSFFHVSDH